MSVGAFEEGLRTNIHQLSKTNYNLTLPLLLLLNRNGDSGVKRKGDTGVSGGVL